MPLADEPSRRRLIDHWRREERDARRIEVFACDEVEVGSDERDDTVDPPVGMLALARLGPHHRAALTLRYVDGLSVTEVARELARGRDATDALLQRARRAFRRAYEEVRTHA